MNERPITLETDIQNFFDANLHVGFSRPFVLDSLEANRNMRAVNPALTTYQTILKGINDEDLPEIDRTFNAGLQDVGSRWEAILRLPSRYYEK